MTNKKLKLISYMYLIIPIIIFVIGYIRTVVAIPIILSIICVLKIIYNQCKEENDIVICQPDEMGVYGHDIIDDANGMFDYINKFTNEKVELEHIKRLRK